MSDKLCASCIWLSDGFGDDVRGSGWCYSAEDYRDYEDTCPEWQASLRDEPVNEPPKPEELYGKNATECLDDLREFNEQARKSIYRREIAKIERKLKAGER